MYRFILFINAYIYIFFLLIYLFGCREKWKDGDQVRLFFRVVVFVDVVKWDLVATTQIEMKRGNTNVKKKKQFDKERMQRLVRSRALSIQQSVTTVESTVLPIACSCKKDTP